MRAINRTKETSSLSFLPWACTLVILGAALLAGCAAGEKSVASMEDLGLDLTSCLPMAPDGWMADPLDIDERITNLVVGKIDASREYNESEDKGEVEIHIRTSAWCCWLVNFSGDLEKLEIQGRKAGLDPKKNKAVLYVALTHNVVVIFEAHKMSNAVEAVKYFASKTDLDCLKEKFKEYKKEYRQNVL